MRLRVAAVMIGLSLFGASAASAQSAPPADGAPARSTAPKDASLYFIAPTNGEVVGRHVHIVFGTRNFGVAPAGVDFPNTGHHHLLIDTPLPPLDQPIPFDKNHVHYGTGATETTVDLPPGRHTLQLLMGDANHVPHDPPVMSKQITIFVRPGR